MDCPFVRDIFIYFFLTGSGENHTAYFYRRNNTPPAISPEMTLLRLPGRVELNEKDVEVVCDPLFSRPIELLTGNPTALLDDVKNIVRHHLEDERPKRTRKPRVLAL